MNVRFYFIRHAQSADNQYVADNAHIGIRSSGPGQVWFNRQHDPEVSLTGHKQIEALRNFIAARKQTSTEESPVIYPYHESFNFTHVYSSPLVRTIETARAIAATLGVTHTIWMDLHEMGGCWQPDAEGKLIGAAGKNRRYFEQRFPECVLPDDLGDEGWWNRPLESGPDGQARAQRLLQTLLERHGSSDDRVAVISHGLFYSVLMRTILRMAPDSKIIFAMNNTAITRIDFVDGYTRVIYQNRCDFLPPDLIT